MKNLIKKLKALRLYFVSERFGDLWKEKVAICLYKLGKKPCATMFIDEVTVMYGYGKCHNIGVFEYNLPSRYIQSKAR